MIPETDGRMFQWLAAVLLISACALPGRGGETLWLTLDADGAARDQAHVSVRLRLPATLLDSTSVTLVDSEGDTLEAQISRPGIFTDAAKADDLRELHFVIPSLQSGETRTLKSAAWNSVQTQTLDGRFHWVMDEGKSAELRYGDKSVMRYMYEKLDDSTPPRREETYKVFHHLFDPSGQVLLTKGPGGKYTHHRGLFYGFNKIRYGDGKECDVWHCKGKAYQAHGAFGESAAGAVLGRHSMLVDWHGAEGEVFAHEWRQLSAWKSSSGVLLEFASSLTPASGPVHLDGDPQHAGFHFRASNEVAESTAKETYYLRPDGRGGMGETRNWPDQPAHVNLPWNAMSFVVGGRRYTALYLDHPSNPKEARFSERDYGRFGSYFVYDLDPADPQKSALNVRYRLWLQEGEMTVEQAAALSRDFVNPVQVTTEWK